MRYDDMLLKTDDAQWMKSPAAQSLNGDPWRGTAFTWQVTGMMFAQMVPTTLPVFMGLFHFSLATTMAFFVPSMVLHGTGIRAKFSCGSLLNAPNCGRLLSAKCSDVVAWRAL
jgi:hypothetical protein